MGYSLSIVRDGAIIIACLSFAFSIIPTSENNSKTKLQVSTAEASTAKLSSGQEARIIDEHLKVRREQVRQDGAVVLSSSPISRNSTPIRAEVPQAELLAADIEQQPHLPAKNTQARDKLTHPAPFTDEKAAASIKSISENFKGSPTLKIGYHVDGSKMSANEKEEQIRRVLSTIGDDWTIAYKAQDEKLRLYVFTDTTCPYCKSLHNSIDRLNREGISVHYLLYPRDMATAQPGELSATAVNMKNIWCSADQTSAMDSAFEGYKIPFASCDNLPENLKRPPAPIPDHYALGMMFGVAGTPTYFASNGKSGAGSSIERIIELAK